MSFLSAQEYLNSFINNEKHLNQVKSSSFTLDNIKNLLKLLGNPQDQLSIIHVAGSKGKGSTCAFTAQILHEAGYTVGLYTSPHLEDMTERIRILNPVSLRAQHSEVWQSHAIFADSISEEKFQMSMEAIKPSIKQVKKLTYFEVLTALAIFYFAQEKVDFTVLETGLGGRLDATNVGISKVCAITPIGLEHTAILGSTLAKIAGEKASIIKDARQKVVIAPQVLEAQKVIEERCQKFNIQSVLVKNLDDHFKISLLGQHQKANAATAIEIIKCLRQLNFMISDEAIQEGLQKTYWPGRFEIVHKEPTVILDSAHTPESARVLMDTIQEVLPNRKVLLILGVANDKDKQTIGKELNKITDQVIVTQFNHPRSGYFEDGELQNIFLNKKCIRTNSVQEALNAAYQNYTPEHVILVTGSIFLIAEARRLCISTED